MSNPYHPSVRPAPPNVTQGAQTVQVEPYPTPGPVKIGTQSGLILIGPSDQCSETAPFKCSCNGFAETRAFNILTSTRCVGTFSSIYDPKDSNTVMYGPELGIGEAPGFTCSAAAIPVTMKYGLLVTANGFMGFITAVATGPSAFQFNVDGFTADYDDGKDSPPMEFRIYYNGSGMISTTSSANDIKSAVCAQTVISSESKSETATFENLNAHFIENYGEESGDSVLYIGAQVDPQFTGSVQIGSPGCQTDIQGPLYMNAQNIVNRSLPITEDFSQAQHDGVSTISYPPCDAVYNFGSMFEVSRSIFVGDPRWTASTGTLAAKNFTLEDAGGVFAIKSYGVTTVGIAQNDALVYTMQFLNRGVYELKHDVAMGSAMGFIQIESSSGGSWVLAREVDCYAATAGDYAIMPCTSYVVIQEPGIIRIRFTATSKNAASSGYAMWLLGTLTFTGTTRIA